MREVFVFPMSINMISSYASSHDSKSFGRENSSGIIERIFFPK
jgi:hypothetical protein